MSVVQSLLSAELPNQRIDAGLMRGYALWGGLALACVGLPAGGTFGVWPALALALLSMAAGALWTIRPAVRRLCRLASELIEARSTVNGLSARNAELETALASAQAILTSLPLPVWQWPMASADPARKQEAGVVDERDWWAGVHPDDQPALAEACRTALADAEPLRTVCRWRADDGAWRHFQLTGSPLAGGDRLIVCAADITALTQENREIVRREARLRGALDLIDAGVLMLDAQNYVVHANQAYCRLFGFDAAALAPGTPYEQLIMDVYLRYLDSHSGVPLEMFLQQRLGDVVDAERWEFAVAGRRLEVCDRRLPGGGKVRQLSDVTAMRDSQREIQERGERLELVLSSTIDGIWDWDLRDGQLYCSPRFRQMLGLAPEDRVPSHWGFVHEDYRALFSEKFRNARLGVEDSNDFECRLLGPGGEPRWFRLQSRNIKDATGTVIRFVGSLSDIHDRKQAELASADMQRLLELTIDHLDAGVCMFDAHDRFVFCNRRYAQIFELPQALLQPGTRFTEFLTHFYIQHPDVRPGHTVEEAVAHRMRAFHAGGEGTEWRVRDRWYFSFDRQLASGGTIALRIDITAFKQAQLALAERSELLELALQASNDGLWDWNLRDNENYLSPRWKALLGYADDEVGRDIAFWQSRIHPDDRDFVLQSCEEHFAGRAPYNIDYRMLTRSGEWRWFNARGVAVRDSTGEIRRMVGFTSDIHDRKQQALELQGARRLLAESVEAMDAGIARFDAEDNLVFCNQQFRELYQLHPTLCTAGTPLSHLLAFIDAHAANPGGRRLIPSARSIQTQVPAPFEFVLGERCLMVSLRPTADHGMVSVHTDISALKEIQVELDKSRARAESASEAKTQFLTNMSHELRTPLNGVLGMLQLLETPDIATPYDEYVRIALRAGRSLLDLINDVLDFSRIESGALRMVSINLDLRELLEEVVASWGIQAANKGLSLSCAVPADLPRLLRGDPLRLRQVLSNLIGNAVKFTERGKVEIAVTVIEQGQALRLEVIDTGIGMSSASQHKVLEPFAQNDGGIARDFSGIGLGLAISRELVACMHGALQLESTLGEGTRVWFELPMEHAAAEAGAEKEAPAVAFIGRVLVVDDEEINRVVAVAMLQRLGLSAQAVDGASSALRALHEEKVDLILMDVRMQDTDGYEATRLLRAGWGDRCPPVVAMTAYVTPENRERAKLAGMMGYLIKPLTVESLTASLCHWLPLAPPQPSAPRAMSFRAGDQPLSPIKLDELREHFDDDGLRTLFATFAISLQQQHGEFAQALAQAEWRRLAEVAASIKGIAENVGAYRLCALAARMERAAKAGNVAECKASLDFMAALGTEFEDAVRAQFGTMGEPRCLADLAHR